MKTCSRLTWAFLLLAIVGCGKSSEQKMAAAKDEIPTAEDLSKIQIRGELGYLPNSDEPHTGWIKKLYNGSAQVQCLLKLDEGKPSEFRMWYANGSPAVVVGIGEATTLEDLIEETEQFTSVIVWQRKTVIPDGLFTVWHENGQKKSEAHYKNGKLDGLRTSWHENGRKRLEAHYKNGERDGPWNYWHENGQKAEEAHYNDGKNEGLETRWYSNGQKEEESHWKDGKADGLWTKWHENGKKKDESHWKNAAKEGLRTLWHENGRKRLEAHYKNGEEDGLWTFWDENGQKELETYIKNGKEVPVPGVHNDMGISDQEGASGSDAGSPQARADYPPGGRRLIRHWPNGNKMLDISIVNDEQHGPATSWHKNGMKMKEGQFNQGKKDGLWTEWYESGQKMLEVHYKNGVFHGPATSYTGTGDNKEAQGNYKNGKKVGLWTIYYIHEKNNPRKVETKYKDGKRDGLEIDWHKNGQKKSEAYYKNDVLISRKEF